MQSTLQFSGQFNRWSLFANSIAVSEMAISVDAYLPGLTVSSLATGLFVWLCACPATTQTITEWLLGVAFYLLEPDGKFPAGRGQESPLHPAEGGEEGRVPEPVLKAQASPMACRVSGSQHREAVSIPRFGR